MRRTRTNFEQFLRDLIFNILFPVLFQCIYEKSVRKKCTLLGTTALTINVYIDPLTFRGQKGQEIKPCSVIEFLP